MASAINEYTCLMSTEGTAVKFNYLKIKELKKSQSVHSPIFVTGGRTWRIMCSLEGNKYVSLFLEICEYQEKANAIFSMYLLYKDGKPSWTTLKTASNVFQLSRADILSSGLQYRGFSRFVKTTDLEENASFVMTQNLLVAADRYGIERLKLICEDMLCKKISLNTLLSFLSLAYTHNCGRLKDACLDFIAVPKNRADLALNMEYLKLIISSPSLMDDIQAKVSQSSSSQRYM